MERSGNFWTLQVLKGFINTTLIGLTTCIIVAEVLCKYGLRITDTGIML